MMKKQEFVPRKISEKPLYELKSVAMEEAKKGEAEDVLKKLLASGMTAEEILAKLQ